MAQTKAGRRIGYARVSTSEQRLDHQLDALKGAACDLVFTDEGISGRKAKRPGLDAMLAALAPGDTLIVYKLSRLGRSTKHLATLLTEFIDRDIAIHSLSEGLNISTASGKLMYHLISAFAEYNADIIRENTISGMQAAKARGKHIGRPFKLSLDQVRRAHVLVHAGRTNVSSLSRRLGVSPSTLGRNFERLDQEAA